MSSRPATATSRRLDSAPAVTIRCRSSAADLITTLTDELGVVLCNDCDNDLIDDSLETDTDSDGQIDDCDDDDDGDGVLDVDDNCQFVCPPDQTCVDGGCVDP